MMKYVSSGRRKSLTIIALGLLFAPPKECHGFPVSCSMTPRRPALPMAGPVVTSSEIGKKTLEHSERDGDEKVQLDDSDTSESSRSRASIIDYVMTTLQPKLGGRPPAQVEDTEVLFYDVALIINLSLSISFWATHRMDFNFIGAAVSEGCLMSLMWIGAGLYTGAFLNSAVDGHYGSLDERGGPKAAGLLGFHTFLNAVNLRLVFSLVAAVLEHRPVGSGLGEDLLPLEIGFGFILMACWRMLHSVYVPRM